MAIFRYRATFTEDFEYSFFNETIGKMQDYRSTGYNFTQVFMVISSQEINSI